METLKAKGDFTQKKKTNYNKKNIVLTISC